MTSKEKQLAAKLLDMASDQFSNHGCNDLPDNWLEDFTQEEKRALAQDMVDHNIFDQEDLDDYGDDFEHLLLHDSIMMTYFAKKLMKG